jgi:hypothetical protein
MAPPTSPGGEPAALYAKHQLAGWLAVETVQTPLCFSHTREMRYAVRARLFATAAPLELKGQWIFRDVDGLNRGSSVQAAARYTS